MSKKHTQEFIENFFEENGCKLLSEYTGANNTVEYICECGNKSKTTFSRFKNGARCQTCGAKKSNLSRHFSFDYVFNFFKENGCQLLESEYINSNVRMKFICYCGEESSITFYKFKQTKRCRKCGYKKLSEIKSFNFEYVNNFFIENGYKLLSDQYVNNYTKLLVECPEGHQYETTFQNFKSGYRCGTCAGNIKYTYDEVYNYFKENDCELLDSVYINSNSKLKYKCECGGISYVTFNDFKNENTRCKQCAYKRLSESKKLSYDFVKNFISDNSFTLISESYEDSHQLLEIKCNEGHIYKASFDAFKRGNRCPTCWGRNKYNREVISGYLNEKNCVLLNKGEVNITTPIKFKCSCGNIATKWLTNLLNNCMCNECYYKSRRGENNPNWNPNISDEERELKRKYPEYQEWRISIFKRDDYTCQICFSRGGKLNAHHLYSYHEYEELRLDVDNGITLCENCHIDFHHVYGNKDNTKDQFLEYMNDIHEYMDLNLKFF